jgi:hypothetical protein
MALLQTFGNRFRLVTFPCPLGQAGKNVRVVQRLKREMAEQLTEAA